MIVTNVSNVQRHTEEPKKLQPELVLNQMQRKSIDAFKKSAPKYNHYPDDTCLKLMIEQRKQEKAPQQIASTDDISIVRQALMPGAARTEADLEKASVSFNVLVQLLLRRN